MDINQVNVGEKKSDLILYIQEALKKLGILLVDIPFILCKNEPEYNMERMELEDSVKNSEICK